ncbi:LysM domain-containing protein [Desulfotomaculum arcticum]|uniref:LysM domain-containing protein n=1 Tax=Desulfotruncus arcticus DSM 17038 TaxID=1121424 RepID=A0A1I2T0W5_9FIRM|nr:LysM peptidoglycan-binding domain-containing protein [Desulfotruncus arcticus]SFG58543.1 LysM domain-containing protein [Desulfotomaculum arcticum] [Desulfotruncus arcticus DSM 17038]
MATYQIKRGDTLHQVAERHGLTPQQLAELNGFREFKQFRAGQRVYIPDYAYDYYEYPRESEYATRYYDDIRYDIRTRRRRCHHGEDIPIIYSYCNLAKRPKSFRYPDGRRVGFVVSHHGREIRRWDDHDFGYHKSGVFMLGPGECRTYRSSWDLRDHRGYYVSHGPHIIRAYDRSYSKRYVEADVEVLGIETGPSKVYSPCSRSNMLRNPDFEKWLDRNVPENWSAVNVKRSSRAHSGNYAAELGAAADKRAILSQSVPGASGRIYEVTFWASENLLLGRVSDFKLEVAIYVYNDRGRQIGRVDPVYRPESLPNGTYQQFTFSTGLLPSGTDWMELRFEFRPGTGNISSVLVDDVSLKCKY